MHQLISQIRFICLRAWEKVSPLGQSHPSSVNVKQSNGETYTDFIAQLKQNLVRTVAQTELRDMLLPMLAYDNANSECQKVLQPLKTQGKPLEDYIKAFFSLHTHTHFVRIFIAIVLHYLQIFSPIPEVVFLFCGWFTSLFPLQKLISLIISHLFVFALVCFALGD